MKLFYSEKFIDTFQKLPAVVKRKAEKQGALFINNMFYPSLNTEKLSPKHLNFWSFRIDRTYRVIFHFEKDVVTFLYAGHHKDIYRIDLFN